MEKKLSAEEIWENKEQPNSYPKISVRILKTPLIIIYLW
jgi:hypothetical protein